MNADLQRRIQRYGWDKAAAVYENSWSRQLEPGQSLMLKLAGLRPGDRVADIACGTGLVTLRAAEAVGPSGFVTGTDISEQMIQLAAAIAGARHVTNVDYRRMAAEELDLPSAVYDAALSAFGLMYVTSPQDACREMYRILKAGGRAAVAVWGARRNCGWAGIFPIVDARVKSEVCPMFFQLGTGDSLLCVMEKAGFREVKVERIQALLRYESEAEALDAAFAGGPVALAHSRFDARTKVAAYAEYLASIAAYRRGGGFAIPAEFVVATGHKS